MGINFERIFQSYGVRYTTTSPNLSRGWIGTSCPYCGDTSDHLGWNAESGACSCWKCGKHPSVGALSQLLGLGIKTVIELVQQHQFGKSYIKREDFVAASKPIELPGTRFTDREIMYMRERGLADKHISYADLRGGGIAGDWAFRLVIPLIIHKQIVGATGRSIIKGMEPRYRNIPKDRQIIEMKSTFLGLDHAGSTPCVVEGPIDAIKGGPGFISGFGATLTSKQLLILSQFKKVYFFFDQDITGISKARKWATEVAMIGVDTEVLSADNDLKDLGSAPEEMITSIRQELGFGGSW